MSAPTTNLRRKNRNERPRLCPVISITPTVAKKKLEIAPGSIFGRSTYLRDMDVIPRRSQFMCVCGQTFVSCPYRVMKNGGGCGCAKHKTKPGRSSPEYTAWGNMIARCSNPNRTGFDRYGGRGISVCEEWKVFDNFLRDMGQRPSRAHSLDRVDNDKGYGPHNCKWSTRTQQNRNKASNRLIEHRGITMTIADWGELSGLGETLRQRLWRGWDFEKAIFLRQTDPRHLLYSK